MSFYSFLLHYQPECAVHSPGLFSVFIMRILISLGPIFMIYNLLIQVITFLISDIIIILFVDDTFILLQFYRFLRGRFQKFKKLGRDFCLCERTSTLKPLTSYLISKSQITNYLLSRFYSGIGQYRVTAKHNLNASYLQW